MIDEVNSWVKESTGVIESIIPKNFPNAPTLILASALYFKGSWSKPFMKSKTQEKFFYQLNGETALVPYMTETMEMYSYASNYLSSGTKQVKIKLAVSPCTFSSHT